jgi:hypothetical protein
VPEESITLFDPDTNTHSVLKVGNNKRKYKQKDKGYYSHFFLIFSFFSFIFFLIIFRGPKRSKSAFMYFCMDKRKEISLKNPSIRMVDMAKELSRMWGELKDKTVISIAMATFDN